MSNKKGRSKIIFRIMIILVVLGIISIIISTQLLSFVSNNSGPIADAKAAQLVLLVLGSALAIIGVIGALFSFKSKNK